MHRGGKTETVWLDDAYRETAVRAAQIMGLRIAGVDLLESSDGPQVMEVNSSPGLEGIEAATAWTWQAPASISWLPRLTFLNSISANA